MRGTMMAGVLVLAVAAADAGRTQTAPDLSEDWDVTGGYEGTYVCTRDAVAGLTYDDTTRQWDGSGARDDLGARQVFRIEKVGLETTSDFFAPAKPVRAMAYRVTTAEIDKDLDDCVAELGGAGHVFLWKTGMVRCHFAEWTYVFQARTLRYLQAYFLDHAEDQYDLAEAPYVAGGSCRKVGD